MGEKKPRGSQTEYHSGNQTHPGIERAPGVAAIKIGGKIVMGQARQPVVCIAESLPQKQ